MMTPLTRTARSPKQAISRRVPKRRDDSGLTTLEWLLIVAAVAGLAALAVVLVQNVVSDTSEQIAGSSARKTAAQIAASEIMNDANRGASAQSDGADTKDEWVAFYTAKCVRLAITYGDAGITPVANFTYNGNFADTNFTVGSIAVGTVTSTTNAAAATDSAIAECRVP